MNEASSNKRQVYLMRHAKTEYQSATGADFDRKLLNSGRNDAQLIGQKLSHLDLEFDVILSSTAARARETVLAVNSALKLSEENIIFVDKLYMAPLAVYEEIISALSPHFDNVLIVGHNNGITDFANHKVEGFRIDALPTAAVLGFQMALNDWNSNTFDVSGSLLHYFNPINLR